MKIVLLALNGRYSHSCPALFYVREQLRVNMPDCEVELRQYTINDPYYETLLSITAAEPDVVFLSVYIWNARYMQRLAHDLKQLFPTMPVVLGGPQAGALVDEGAVTSWTVVRGEIEGIDRRFYTDLQEGTLAGEYIGRSGHSFPSPYQEHDFTDQLAKRYVYYESSRGCPFCCSYCLSSIDKGVRLKDVDQVKKELDLILRHEPKIIKFVDRTFNVNSARSLAIWQFLRQSAARTRFHFEIAPDLFTDEMFIFLEDLEPGRFQFEIGLQSTNARVLAAVNRRIDTAVAKENIARLSAMDNIHLHVDLILGLPHETADLFRRSFNEVFALAPHYLQMGLLKILPGTAIADQAEEFGIIHCRQPPYEILANRWLDHQTLRRLHLFGECVEAFYNNRYFRTVLLYIKETREDYFEFFDALLSVAQKREFFSRAPTQELLSSLLFELCRTMEDSRILHDLLAFDWLRCGHRYLPEHLQHVDTVAVRKKLQRIMAQNCPPLFDYQSRAEFFKKGIFARFDAETLRYTGLTADGDGGYVGFLPQTQTRVHTFQKAVILPVSESG